MYVYMYIQMYISLPYVRVFPVNDDLIPILPRRARDLYTLGKRRGKSSPSRPCASQAGKAEWNLAQEASHAAHLLVRPRRR